MTRPIITALMVSEQSAHKPLRKFGSACIRYPVREGRAEAERGEAVVEQGSVK